VELCPQWRVIREFHHEAHSEIMVLRAEYPQPPDLVEQLEKILRKTFNAIELLADKIDSLETK
jgi:hypothetical protein